MTRKHTSLRKRIVLMVLFLVLVAGSGYTLAATNHFDNPFQVLGQLTGQEMGGDRPAMPNNEAFAVAASSDETSDSAAAATVTTDTSAASDQLADFAAGPGGHEESSGFTWSRIGDVLFNIWFLFAASAVVILVGQPLSYLVRCWRHRRPRQLAAARG